MARTSNETLAPMVWWTSGVNPPAGGMGIGMRSFPFLSPGTRRPPLPAEWPAVDSAHDVGLVFHVPLSLHTLAQQVAGCLPKEPIVTAVLKWDPLNARCLFRLSQCELGDLGTIWLENQPSGAKTTVRVTGIPEPAHHEQDARAQSASLNERHRRYLVWILRSLLVSLSANPLVRSFLPENITRQYLSAEGEPIHSLSAVIRTPFEEVANFISSEIGALLAGGLEDLDTPLGRVNLSMGMGFAPSGAGSIRFEVTGHLVERADGWCPGRRLRTGPLLCLELRTLGLNLTFVEGSSTQPQFLQENPSIGPGANAYLDSLGYIAMVDLAFEELFTNLKTLGESRGIGPPSPRGSLRETRSPYPENEWAKYQVHAQRRRPATVYREWLARRSRLVAQGLRHELADPWDSFKKLIRSPRDSSRR